MNRRARTGAGEDPDEFLAGLRAGYDHGYDIGLAHGRADVFGDPDTIAGTVARRSDGPGRRELLDRGYIPLDRTRPPALPVRLWTTEDWAKADTRDLPTTEHGRADWHAAVDAGQVPATLVEAFAAHEDSVPTAGHDEAISAVLADTARQLAEIRAHLAATAASAESADHAAPDRNRADELARWYDEAFAPDAPGLGDAPAWTAR